MHFVSVIIPAYNAATHLKSCLEHLHASTTADFETIVVDDCSTDDSAAVAATYHARVIPTDARRGPAAARNLGARHAKGDILLFIDSDVLVYPGTIERVIAIFEQNSGVDAVIGSYDDRPGAEDFVSQYRNLMHCYVHQTGRKEACTFWSGCGAIRRELFLAFNGFDESYSRPSIEDIEFGYRLSRAHKKILLDREVLVKHLKHWNLWTLLKTDILDRGVPWMELILRTGVLPNDLNVKFTERLSVALVFLMAGLTALLAIQWGVNSLIPLFAALIFVLCRFWVDPLRYSFKLLLPLTSLILITAWMAWKADMIRVLYPVLLGYFLLMLRDKYASATNRHGLTDLLLAIYMVFSVLFMLWHLPNHAAVFGLLILVAVTITLNLPFYTFLAFKRGRPLFAVTVIPFHLLYHFYNGLSVIIGVARYASHGRAAYPSTRAPGTGKHNLPLSAHSATAAAPESLTSK